MNFDVRPLNMTIDNLIKAIVGNHIMLESIYIERDFDINAKQLFIENILLMLPINNIYLNCQDDKYKIINGYAKIKTIYDFINDKFVLTTLETKFNIRNLLFSELTQSYQTRILETIIDVFVLHSKDNDTINNFYKRISL